MRSETRQSQKDKYHTITLMRSACSNQTRRGGKENRDCQGLGELRLGSLVFNGCAVSDLQDEKSSGDGRWGQLHGNARCERR